MVDNAPLRVKFTHDTPLYRLIAATPIRERPWVLRRMAEGYVDIKVAGLHHQARRLSCQTIGSGVPPVPRLVVSLKGSDHCAFEQHLRETPKNRWGNELRFMAEDYLAFITSSASEMPTTPSITPSLRRDPGVRQNESPRGGKLIDEKQDAFGLQDLKFSA